MGFTKFGAGTLSSLMGGGGSLMGSVAQGLKAAADKREAAKYGMGQYGKTSKWGGKKLQSSYAAQLAKVNAGKAKYARKPAKSLTFAQHQKNMTKGGLK